MRQFFKFLCGIFLLQFLCVPAAFAASSPLSGAKIRAVEAIVPADIRRLPLADFNLSYGKDSDSDGLSDEVSYALGLPPALPEERTDRKQRVLSSQWPSGVVPIDEQFSKNKKGTLLLEPLGTSVLVWYVHPDNGRAHFLGNALNNAKFLAALGIDLAPFKKIEVSIAKQKLWFFLGSVKLGGMKISSGKDGWLTPIGSFRILNKSPRAWSKLAGLWMPYWMGFAGGGKFGIHELPEWPNGRKEGVNHLGLRVSHGCIRLGPKDAKTLYNWASIGTPVVVKKR